MELYEAIAKRRIVRDFKDDDVPFETIEKIIGAGLKAPTHDHLRNWEFVILHGKEEKERALRFVHTGVGPTLEILKKRSSTARRSKRCTRSRCRANTRCFITPPMSCCRSSNLRQAS